MKKAKMMLMAVTVLAVVGGALAFKAKTQTHRYYSTAEVGGACTSPTDIFSTTDGGLIPAALSTVSNPLTTDCGTILLTADN